MTDAKSIVGPDGYFHTRYRKRDGYPDEVVLEGSPWTPDEVEQEYRAQIELVRKHIPWVSHLTNHMGYLRDDPVFSAIVEGLAAEYDLAVDPRPTVLSGSAASAKTIKRSPRRRRWRRCVKTWRN
ncbi:MAG: ChbG/HpnK family deacetylase [Caldilineaceae bacterium]